MGGLAQRISSGSPKQLAGGRERQLERTDEETYRSLFNAGCAITSTLASSAPAKAEPKAETSDGSTKMTMWIGHWMSKGDGAGGKWTARTDCTWTANRRFVVATR